MRFCFRLDLVFVTLVEQRAIVFMPAYFVSILDVMRKSTFMTMLSQRTIILVCIELIFFYYYVCLLAVFARLFKFGVQ